MKKIFVLLIYMYNINNLLVCLQIELIFDEYVFFKDYNGLYVKLVDCEYNINEFVIGSGSNIKICVNLYKKLFEVLV